MAKKPAKPPTNASAKAQVSEALAAFQADVVDDLTARVGKMTPELATDVTTLAMLALDDNWGLKDRKPNPEIRVLVATIAQKAAIEESLIVQNLRQSISVAAQKALAALIV